MQNISTPMNMNTTPAKTARTKDALMQAYRNWINKRASNQKLRAISQPLDPDAYNDVLINALNLGVKY